MQIAWIWYQFVWLIYWLTNCEHERVFFSEKKEVIFRKYGRRLLYHDWRSIHQWFITIPPHSFYDRQSNVIHSYYTEQLHSGHCPLGLAKKNNRCQPLQKGLLKMLSSRAFSRNPIPRKDLRRTALFAGRATPSNWTPQRRPASTSPINAPECQFHPYNGHHNRRLPDVRLWLFFVTCCMHPSSAGPGFWRRIIVWNNWRNGNDRMFLGWFSSRPDMLFPHQKCTAYIMSIPTLIF